MPEVTITEALERKAKRKTKPLPQTNKQSGGNSK